jgi:putative membrane protein
MARRALDRAFDQATRERIAAAVAAAEKATGAEIVPTVVAAADDYPEATWKAAAGGALLAVALAVVVHLWLGGWGGAPLGWSLLPGLLGAAGGGLLAQWQPLRRLLVGVERLERRVRLAAEAAFLEHEVFATRDRTGVLVFVSLFEHRVVVLGDAGINARVPPERWQGIADAVALGIRQGRPGEALCEAIGSCGALLAARGVERRADDRNELPDVLRLGDPEG